VESDMKKPNFFIIGAPKCGTTSLVDWLGQHSRVFMSAFKEPHYFNTDDSFRFVHDEKYYLDLFRDAGPEHLAVGEGSTWYLFSKTAVPEIERFTSGAARYIVCLRNPVEMVHSLHGQIFFSGNENERDFCKAWNLQELRLGGEKLPPLTNAASHLQYARACALGMQVKRLLEVVPRERVCFIFLEDLSNNPEGTVSRVFDFLDLPQPETPLNLVTANQAHKPRSILLNRLISLGRVVRNAMGLKRGLGVLTHLRNANKLHGPRENLSPEMLATLTSAFESDIVQLEKLVERDLSHWRAP
jgi:hypothetical protein